MSASTRSTKLCIKCGARKAWTWRQHKVHTEQCEGKKVPRRRVATGRAPDLTVLWWRAIATGVAWFPIVVGDKGDQEAEYGKLKERFRRKGGIETFVREYRELSTRKKTL